MRTIIFNLVLLFSLTSQASLTSQRPLNPYEIYDFSAVIQTNKDRIDTCGYGIKVISETDGELTKLQVQNTYVYGSGCPVFVVDPVEDYTVRTYSINAIDISCGSLYIEANNEKGDTLLIVDHTRRTCRDLVPAKMEIEETIQGVLSYFLSGISQK